jgi:hypothetical protein
MLLRGELGAIVHLCVAKFGSHAQITVSEVFDDHDSSLHTYVSWPAQGQWVKEDQSTMTRWHEVWGKEEPRT